MPLYAYICNCGLSKEVDKPINKCSTIEICQCGREMTKDYSGIAIHGTRDGFGIRNGFYDPKTKQYIDTRSKWEKAGFMQPKDSKAPDHIHKITAEKMKRKSFNKKTPALDMAERV